MEDKEVLGMINKVLRYERETEELRATMTYADAKRIVWNRRDYNKAEVWVAVMFIVGQADADPLDFAFALGAFEHV